VDCASLPESLLESELFGHERGAFTGAVQRRMGRLERAGGGTLFLDEVGEIPPASQSKLLRFLETRTFERLGGEGPITVDTRIVAATNRDLEVSVAEGGFREDLYYRLHVVPIRVPALRDRPGDIPLLVAHFLRRSEDPCRVSPAALDALLAHTWPGNVRELRNAVDHARVMARGGVIQPSHLPAAVTGTAAGASAVSADDERLRAMVTRWVSEGGGEGDLHAAVMERLEVHLLREVLARNGGNQVQAAKVLGIHRTTLRERMTRYGIES
jgi:DNA-binding NtrC family response regulator